MSSDTQLPDDYRAALAAFKAGDHRTAIDLLTRCVAVDPTDVQARVGLGMACAAAGDLNEAERHLRATVALAPSHVPARLKLAAIAEQSGRRDDAHEMYVAAARVDPSNEVAREGAARTTVPGGTAAVAPNGSSPTPATVAGGDWVTGVKRGDTGAAGALRYSGGRPLVTYPSVWMGFLLIVGVLGLRLVAPTQTPGLPTTLTATLNGSLRVLEIGVVAVGVLLVARAALASVRSRYLVYEHRVDIVSGAIVQRKQRTWLYDVMDIGVAQGPLTMLCGSGRLTLAVDGVQATSGSLARMTSWQPPPPALVGFGSYRFLDELHDQLEQIRLADRFGLKGFTA